MRLGLSFTHVIMRDNTYDMVGFQEVLKYGRKSGVQLGDYDIVSYAQAFGANGYRVETLTDFATVPKQALFSGGRSAIARAATVTCKCPRRSSTRPHTAATP